MRKLPAFTCVTSEGALLPVEMLQRIAHLDSGLGGLSAEDYDLFDMRLNEAISDSWHTLLRTWKVFRAAIQRETTPGSETSITRRFWLLPLFAELGYGRLVSTKPLEIEGKSYPISHFWFGVPIHLIGCHIGLDQVVRSSGRARQSAFSLVQEYLGRSPEALWGFVSNGLRLRLLRKNVSLTRQAYIEFDFEAMMESENYAEFTLLWLLCHVSRVNAEEQPERCWLEQWAQEAQKRGVRALEQLRDGVEEAIRALGSGFLAHRANQRLREKLRSGELKPQEYYRQVLRFVYRLIVLFVAEDREVLLHPEAREEARERYKRYYSTARLRWLAERRLGSRHSDLYHGLRLVMEGLGWETGCPELGLPALNGFLFSEEAMPDVLDCVLSNQDLLKAIRSLAFTYEGSVRRAVDYRHLGAEELGSVYESLLELQPDLNIETAQFILKTVSGNERKTSGSYYTPSSLIESLLDSALEPVLAEACEHPDPEQAILQLKVCDPACGSGHFLIAATRRMARRLAVIRAGNEEPSQRELRRALRDVIGHCIYGVDINPMSVELCKVNLWLEALEPGKPLSFLDAHIQCGNSLLGTTPALLKNGIPNEAFEAIEGDDKKFCNARKKENKAYRAGQLSFLARGAEIAWDHWESVAAERQQMEAISDDTVTNVHRKQKQYVRLLSSKDYTQNKLWADMWCGAFVWKKTKEHYDLAINEDVFRQAIRNPEAIGEEQRRYIQSLAEQYQFFHWHLAFPDVFQVPSGNEEPENALTGWSGGFDVVLGNPPWERIKIQEKEWFSAHGRSDIANASNAAQRRKMIEALEREDFLLSLAFKEALRQAEGESHLVRHSGRFPLCGRGDINRYSIFTECMRQILHPRGRIGCIVPSGIATDDTTKVFFQDLMDSRTLVSLYDFENRNKVFPAVDSRMKFSLLTLSGTERPAMQGARFAFFLHDPTELKAEERAFVLTAEEIALLNPNTRTCPIFRSQRDAELTKQLYRRAPVLVREDGKETLNPWQVTFIRMFDMANDSHLFHTCTQLQQDGWTLRGNIFYRGNEKCYPLYEGKMISHYDHRFGGYTTTAEEAEQGIDRRDPFAVPLPRYWIHERDMNADVLREQTALLAFRDVTNTTNERTAIFDIIPAVAVGHTMPLIAFGGKDERLMLNFTSSVSSFAFDFIARQKLGGTHLTFFILKQLPVLPPETYKQECVWQPGVSLGEWILPRALELTYTAWDLEAFARECGYAGPPFRWDEERRFLLRCELDAAFFHLYGVEREDVASIMETFPLVKKEDEKRYGEYRSRRMILEIYDALQEASEQGAMYQTRLEPPPADPSVAHSPRQ
uniref:site-specific DNA-methyltransferase (adenine-specific) n=1 Tax=Thermosporothrix sp. COM3 TaxID=2490863 RepID=A0A455SXM6_9CHLR|nr:hypothetical protein KTC_64030 [Thermosporothrix sp. COM3]